jgi:Ca2+-binding EF-hand superfamily protein
MAFSMFDHDGDGNISASELMSVMKKLGYQVKKSDVHGMFKKVDLDGQLYADFACMTTNNFCNFYRQRPD